MREYRCVAMGLSLAIVFVCAGAITHVGGGQPPALYAGLTWNVGRFP